MELGRVRLNLDGVDRELPLSDAFLLYQNSQFDPGREWELRGYKAHDVDRERLNELRETAIEEYLNSDRFGPADFEDVKRFFVELVDSPREAVKRNFPDRNFYFVLGVPRTGGHYLLNNLLELNDYDLMSFVYGMISDFCPSIKTLYNADKEEGFLYGLFEFAQMLAWAEDVFEGSERIYKKQVGFSYVVHWLDQLFGDQATYLVTVRHPITSLESKVEFDLGKDIDFKTILTSRTASIESMEKVVVQGTNLTEREWDSLPLWKQHSLRWMVHYTSIVKNGGPKGEVIPLSFGKNVETFLEQHARNIGTVYESSEDFDPKDRGVDGLMNHEFVNGVIAKTRAAWAEHDYDFPEITEY